MEVAKVLMSVALVALLYGGVVALKNWSKIFGRPQDDPTETAGARSYGITHIVAIYLVTLSFMLYFICN